MNFIKKEIIPEIVGIIDIGTYKIRVGICEIINREVKLLGYGEKRQDSDFIVMQEFKNLKGVCNNIEEAIIKAEKDGNIKVSKLIINIPSPELFFEHSKINYIRENTNKKINEKELYSIMNSIEKSALKKHYKQINKNSGYTSNDLKLIISNISEISLDKIKVKKVIHTNPKEINISLVNVFIPEIKYELIKYIEEYLGKKITKIIPSEYAITNLFIDKSDIVIIDMGSSHTSIIIKKDNHIIGAKKLSFGINDLIKNIRKNYNLTQIDIINSIDQNIFLKEKEEFLNIFIDILIISVEEILGTKICPNDFFMTGGGANKFIKKYLKETNLNNLGLKIIKKINFVIPKINFLDSSNLDNNNSWIDDAKSNLNIYSMIQTTLNFIKKDKTKIEQTLKKVIKNIN